VRSAKRLAILLAATTLTLLLLVPVLALGDIYLPATVTSFNQAYRGPSGYWGDCGMGTNGCQDTIEIAGCLITSFSMVLDYYDVSLSIPREYSCTATARTGMDPGILNDWLKTHGGYGKCGNDIGSCCLEWTHLPPQISVTQYVNHSESGVDSTAQRTIDSALKRGYPVISGVHWGSHCHGSTAQTEDCHWVVITGKKGSTYTIIDPYNYDTTDPRGVRTTLDRGTFGAYTIDRYVVVKGIVPLSPLAGLRLSVSFDPSGTLRTGAAQVRSISISGGSDMPVLLYIRVVDPHGAVRYAYYGSDSTLHYTKEKHSLYAEPRSFSDGTYVLNESSTAGEDAGRWTWEAWAEEPGNSGRPYGYAVSSYTISAGSSGATNGIAIALTLAIFIASLIYVSMLLRTGN